jgi:hypothetical protein
MDDLFEPILENTTPDIPAILPLYGGAEKSVRDMTSDEFHTIAGSIMTKVREQAFSRGLPIVVEQNGKVIREYADGHIEIVS